MSVFYYLWLRTTLIWSDKWRKETIISAGYVKQVLRVLNLLNKTSVYILHYSIRLRKKNLFKGPYWPTCFFPFVDFFNKENSKISCFRDRNLNEKLQVKRAKKSSFYQVILATKHLKKNCADWQTVFLFCNLFALEHFFLGLMILCDSAEILWYRG